MRDANNDDEFKEGVRERGRGPEGKDEEEEEELGGLEDGDEVDEDERFVIGPVAAIPFIDSSFGKTISNDIFVRTLQCGFKLTLDNFDG